MHVDGFRFDLASTLARELHEVDKLGAFFDIIHQDPVISQVKLIAEPWDLGEGGYQVGNFPALWSEWNGKYRDCIRQLLEGRRRRGLRIRHAVLRIERPVRMEQPPPARQHQLRHLPRRLHAARPGVLRPEAQRGQRRRQSRRHRRQHQLELRRRRSDRRSEDRGPSRRARNATSWPRSLLSQGVPMLLGGDEIGHTQHGNNNAYCQDNELTWLNWELAADQKELLNFVHRVIKVCHEQPVFHRRRFFHGRALKGAEAREIAWLDPNGKEMSDEAWNAPFVRCLGSAAVRSVDRRRTSMAKRSGETLCFCCSMPTTRTRFHSCCPPRAARSLGS